MTIQDQLLQNCLDEFNQGRSLDEIIANVPPESAGIIPQLRLAVEARGLPPVTMAPEKAQAQRAQVKQEARRVLSPAFLRFIPSWAVAPAGALAVLVVLLIAFSAILAKPASSYATVMNVEGIVEVADDIAAPEWAVLQDGDRVAQGQYVRTRFGSSATLVFFEGTRATLGQDTQVGLQVVEGSGRTLTVELAQINGVTEHSVVPLHGNSSAYIVHTASGQASVHGTAFTVDSTAGATRFAVEHGKVEVNNAEESVFLTAGQAAVVLADETPSDPTFEFAVQGTITAIAGDQWTVGGLTFTVDPALIEGGAWAEGDWVWVRGRILSDGSLVADKISYPNNSKERSNFTGVVESMGDAAWVVSGKTVAIDAETEFDEGIAVGDPVEVSFTILPDGTWLAKEIEALEDDQDQPVATPTVDPAATPEVIETPEGTRAGCDVTDKQHPTGLTLSARYGVSYEEIMVWFCKGYGLGEIDLAYELSQTSGMPVSEIFAMRESGIGWGNIKKEVEKLAEDTPSPDDDKKQDKDKGKDKDKGEDDDEGDGEDDPSIEETPQPDDKKNDKKPTKTPKVKPTKKPKP
ncbi:MAG: FecR domain-containing protein [Anaerolineaceae bacterium]|nr:FecR domain-containing protein [Anaerolineaceae bacterium]